MTRRAAQRRRVQCGQSGHDQAQSLARAGLPGLGAREGPGKTTSYFGTAVQDASLHPDSTEANTARRLLQRLNIRLVEATAQSLLATTENTVACGAHPVPPPPCDNMGSDRPECATQPCSAMRHAPVSATPICSFTFCSESCSHRMLQSSSGGDLGHSHVDGGEAAKLEASSTLRNTLLMQIELLASSQVIVSKLQHSGHKPSETLRYTLSERRDHGSETNPPCTAANHRWLKHTVVWNFVAYASQDMNVDVSPGVLFSNRKYQPCKSRWAASNAIMHPLCVDS
ncbi:hypothetical protein P154DRAFT_575896 [Amniculicola lignicola CBS 123094]|uniref:Uncharacterized protein n=1 Tax=Amniculicola lignicola CBS 123094 TaxID=1392246 RepID=A0A6A5WFX9_9PLEO|nr:hypothetical protein P154DRAFT_575896 [Amniculicola lignicola CBS 123094]